MSGNDPKERAMRDQLRAYLLGTLDDATRAEVDKRIWDEPEWATALGEERERLAVPDLRSHKRPSDGSTQKANTVFVPVFLSLAFVVVVLCFALLYSDVVPRLREAASKASAENNFKQWGIVFNIYASESKSERFPPAVEIDGLWVPDLRVLYPVYLNEASICICPNMDSENLQEALRAALEREPPDWDTAHRIAGRGLIYTGFAMTTNQEISDFGEQIQTVRSAPDEDLQVGKNTIYRLRSGVERFYLTAVGNPAATAIARSKIPILFENIFDRDHVHYPEGGYVLFMDGHIEFLTPDHDVYRSIQEPLARILRITTHGE